MLSYGDSGGKGERERENEWDGDIEELDPAVPECNHTLNFLLR